MRFEDLDSKTLDQIAPEEVNTRARELIQNQHVQFSFSLADRIQAVV